MKIMILNGPNINMLGIREPEIYGSTTYDDLVEMIRSAKGDAHELYFCQSNHEGDLIDALQKAHFEGFDGVVFNPGGYTHTSIAIMDAILSISVPVVEVHLSDISRRESYRNISYTGMAAATTIMGKGPAGYIEAIDFLEKSA